jgi:cysteine desulfurase family protein (TIGR01976 family)
LFADSPGGSQVPDTVIEAMANYLHHSNANTHGTFVTSEETDRLIEAARRAGADFLGCDPDEIVFGPNATSLLFSFSRSITRTLRPGDEIVVTHLDHDANVAPWLLVAEDTGATIRYAGIHEADVTLDLDSLDVVLGPRTKVVAFTLASNAVGAITPAAEVVRCVRAKTETALVVADGVHLAQHRLIDARAIGADIVVTSPYKFFGPHMGMAFGRREVLAALKPYKVRPATDEVPGRWETGTLNHEGLAGVVAAVEYLADIGNAFGPPPGPTRRAALTAGFSAIHAHETVMAERFLNGLADLPHVRLWGIEHPARLDERTPTFAIRVGEQHPLETAKLLGERGIFVWDGHYYAVEVMQALGLLETGGAVRIGFCHYNTPGEVDRVLAELATLA